MEFTSLLSRMDTFCGDDMEIVIQPELADGEKKLVLLTHDESCFESNDGKKTMWIEKDKRILKPGKNADVYWGNKDLVEQTKVAITLFEILHPGCIALFAFDNSANHHAYAQDALKSARLSLSDKGNTSA
jgi:hypothetical protein